MKRTKSCLEKDSFCFAGTQNSNENSIKKSLLSPFGVCKLFDWVSFPDRPYSGIFLMFPTLAIVNSRILLAASGHSSRGSSFSTAE